MSSLAYFMAKDTIDHFNTIVKPIVYLSMFYFFNNPRSSIWENYVVLVALVYCVTGTGYTFAIFFQPGSAQLWSAVIPVILTLVATQQKDTIIADLCYTKWALEAIVPPDCSWLQLLRDVADNAVRFATKERVRHQQQQSLLMGPHGQRGDLRCIAFFCMVVFPKH